MIFLLFFLCVFFMFIFYRGKYPLASPGFLNSILWLLLGGLASLGLYRYFIINDKTIFILFIGVLFFNIGFLFKNKVKFKSRLFISKTLNKRIYFYLCLLATFIQLIFFFRCLKLISIGTNFSEIRFAFGEVGRGVFNNAIESLAFSYFVRPMLFVCISQFSLGIVNKILDKKNILISILFIFISFIDFNRVNLLYLFIMLFFSYYIRLKDSNKQIKIKNLFKWLLLFFILLILYKYLSSLRGVNSGIFKSIYEYLVSGVIQLEKRIEYFDSMNLKHTFGFSFFSGLLNIVFFILGNLNIHTLSLWERYLEVQNYINKFIFIHPNVISNAFVTPYFYFYVDFSYFGICLGSFMYGFLCRNIYKYLSNSSFMYKSIYLIMIIGLLTSFVRWQFSQTSYVLSYIYIIFLYIRINVK